MTDTPIGVILGQIGSPDAPTVPAVRRYLREFLSDPRVVEAPRLLWWAVLRIAVLPRRPARSAELYRRIWTERGSPLVLTTLEQARLLEAALGPGFRVEAGMRFGAPPLGEAIDRVLAAGAERVLVVPMFPQYASATTGSLFDAVAMHLRGRRAVPALRFAAPFYAHPAYVRALAAVAAEDLARLPWKPEKIVLSFHGIPKAAVERGDPYPEHVEATSRLLATALGLERGDYEVSYQSRFGRGAWLEPSSEETLRRLGRSGIRRIAVLSPGFLADCLETIDEIGREAANRFREAGGEDFHRVPCLGAHPAWISAFAEIVRGELSGWTKESERP